MGTLRIGTPGMRGIEEGRNPQSAGSRASDERRPHPLVPHVPWRQLAPCAMQNMEGLR